MPLTYLGSYDLVKKAKDIVNYKITSTSYDYRERMHELKAYGCDLHDEWGRFSHSVSLGSRLNTDKEEAYMFVRFCEHAGIPIGIPRLRIAEDVLILGLRKVSIYSYHLAMVTLIRTGQKDLLNQILDVPSLASVQNTHVDDLIDRYMRSISALQSTAQFQQILSDYNLSTSKIYLFLIILSRLCSKCSDQSRSKLLEFILSLCHSDSQGKYFEASGKLIEELFISFLPTLRHRLVPKLLEFPIRCVGHPNGSLVSFHPLSHISIESRFIPTTFTIDQSRLVALLKQAQIRNSVFRKKAFHVLGKLHGMELLKAEVRRMYGRLLWDSSRDQFGFPAGFGFGRHEFLSLPHPTSIDPAALFKNYVLSIRIRVSGIPNEHFISFQSEKDELCEQIEQSYLRIRWTASEARDLMRLLYQSWTSCKERLASLPQSSRLAFVLNVLMEKSGKIIDAMGVVVKISSTFGDRDSCFDALRQVINEMSKAGIPNLRLKAACVRLGLYDKEGVLSRTMLVIHSSNQEVVHDALAAVKVLLISGSDYEDNELRQSLARVIALIGQIVRWRRRVGLCAALQLFDFIVTEIDWMFGMDCESSVLTGLYHLIDESIVCKSCIDVVNGEVDRQVVVKRLRVRRCAARLSCSLWRLYSGRKSEIPAVLHQWRSICQSDNEFAIVCNEWVVTQSH